MVDVFPGEEGRGNKGVEGRKPGKWRPGVDKNAAGRVKALDGEAMFCSDCLNFMNWRNNT